MQKNTRNHIRSLLWNFKKNENNINKMASVLINDETLFFENPIVEENKYKWSLNQIAFNKMFIQVVNSILQDSTSEVYDIFSAKYLNGYPSKDNLIVADEVYLSESTVKRRDNEFLREIALRLGWN